LCAAFKSRFPNTYTSESENITYNINWPKLMQIDQNSFSLSANLMQHL
jgi:hypothetical protein